MIDFLWLIIFTIFIIDCIAVGVLTLFILYSAIKDIKDESQASKENI